MDQMKKETIKEIIEGIAMGAIVSSMLLMSIRINAAGANGRILEEYAAYCEEAGRDYGICPELLEAIMEEESGGDPGAVGGAGEIGLMQIYPKYHRERAERLGADRLEDPEWNVLVAADYLSELFQRYGDVGTVLMAYNGVKDAKERGARGDYTDYAKRVMERAAQLERENGK